MTTYAVITDGTVTNIALSDDPDWAAGQGWIDVEGMDPRPAIGWTFDGDTWTPHALTGPPRRDVS